MRALLLHGGALAIGAVVGLWAGPWTPTRAADDATTGDGLPERLLALQAAATALGEAQRDLARQLDERALTPAAEGGRAAALDQAALEAAAERWLAAHPDAFQPSAGELDLVQGDLSAVPVEELLAFFRSSDAFSPETTRVWERVREAGRIDELLEHAQALAAANPEDAALQTELGLAYLQKLFGLGATPEAGQFAFAADAAFTRALELDPLDRTARFTKAVSLSNWPIVMGRTGEAIEHFEILVGQLEADGPPEAMSEAYLFLGNLYQRGGDLEQALATWRRGLSWFPRNQDLARQLELATGDEQE